MATETSSMGNGANADDTVFGLSATLAAAVGYLLPILGIVFLVMEDDNEFVRFNAAQSVAFAIGLYVVRFAISFTLGLLPTIVAAGIGLLISLVNLVIFFGLVFLAYKAFTGETVELPVFADIARSLESSV
ncbi:DUF4870 domain-containing protein [Haloarcula salina]|uniref:DUF4870 domain-containing protein n=1 Tax=Haloarcula salina TaxID=1429914 RepID=UPI003C6FCEBA